MKRIIDRVKKFLKPKTPKPDNEIPLYDFGYWTEKKPNVERYKGSDKPIVEQSSTQYKYLGGKIALQYTETTEGSTATTYVLQTVESALNDKKKEVIQTTFTEEEVKTLQLQNWQGSSIEAMRIAKILHYEGKSLRQIAEVVKISTTTISKGIRLLNWHTSEQVRESKKKL